MCLDKIQPYLSPVVLSALALLVMTLLGVPVLLTLGILLAIYAYSKGYRIQITLTKKG